MNSLKSSIQRGYRVTVTTWENDADNYNTKTVDGLTESATKFVVKLCKLHQSRRREGCFGNLYDPTDNQIRLYNEALQKLVDEHEGDLPVEYCTDSDGVQEYASELGFSSEEFFTRVFDKIKIEYFPESIEIEDVTEKFV